MSKDNETILRYSFVKAGAHRYQIVADGKVLAGPFSKNSEARAQLSKFLRDHPSARIVKLWHKGTLVPDD